MTNDHKYRTEGHTAEISQKGALQDNELESVSGGFELPTIIDLCQNQFVYQRCVNTPWGSCKNLSRVLVKKEETINHYNGTCAKGCFTNFPYKDDL